MDAWELGTISALLRFFVVTFLTVLHTFQGVGGGPKSIGPPLKIVQNSKL